MNINRIEELDAFLKVSPKNLEEYVSQNRTVLVKMLNGIARNIDEIDEKELYQVIQQLISYQEEQVYVVGVHRFNPLKQLKEMQTVQIFKPKEYLLFMADYLMRNRKIEKELTVLFESVIQENLKGL